MRKIWILSALIMLLITLYQINSAYAKYSTEAEGIVEETIGAWIVKVNNTNIATEVDVQNFTIDALTYNSNDYVLEGKIAPGLLGYFDITIDATEASVAVRYDVTIDFSKLDLSDSIKFTKLVTVVDGVESEEGITQTEERGIALKVTLLQENTSLFGKYLAAEHGFSAWIEDEDKKILFDCGFSGKFIQNADLKDGDQSMFMLAERLKTWYNDGIAQAEIKGKVAGRTEGRAEGKASELLSLAKKMVKDKMDIELIKRYTGFSTKQIEDLKKNM